MNARLKAIALLIFFSFVLAHLVIPHHHHLPDHFASTFEHSHSHEHDGATDSHHEHNACTFTQADHSFVNEKSIVVMSFMCFVILTLVFIWSVEVDANRSFFQRSIGRPPLFVFSPVSFRGPPLR